MIFQDSEPKSAVNKETGMVFQLADGTIQACDRFVESLLGYSAKQLIGQTFFNLPWQPIHPDGSALVATDDPAIVALNSGKPCLNRVLGFYQPDGTLVWLCLNSTPLFQANTTTPYAVVTTLSKGERPQLEAQLCDKVDERVTVILESMTDAFVALDCDWHITYMNQKAVQLTGLTLAETLGKTHWEVWSWSVGKEPEQQYRRAMTEQVSVHFQMLYEPDAIWYEIHAYPSEFGLAIYFRNIYESKRMEAMLRESEERFRAIQELAIDGFILLRSIRNELGTIEDFEWTYANPKGAELLGRSVEALVGKRLLTVVPGNKTEVFDTYVQVAETGQPSQIELFYEADGITGWFRIVTIKIDDGVAISFNNISDRRQMEVALRDSEARYRTLAQAIPQFVFITSAEGQNEYVNQQFCDYTGLSVEQMLNLDWLSILHPLDAERTGDRWMESVRTGEFYEIEYRLRRADGEYRWFLGQAAPLKDEQGRIVQWFGTCTDIHDRKQLEKERVLLFEQERASRQEAETANRLKDEFLAVLSHELRSPLNPILGWTNLLQGGRLDEAKTAQALATIERNAKLQAQLIEDLLDISRIMQGKLMLNATPVSLAFVITAALETVHLAIEAKNIHLEVTLEPNINPVFGDGGRLQQVVWNLLSNAVKFTPASGRVKVNLTSIDDCAQIQVTDTGKGINAEFTPFVFEYFRQEDGSTTRKFGGLGLGLAIARQIVELHGGQIWADSLGEEQGATFTVQLPLLQIENSAIPDEATNLVSPHPSPLTGIRALVVDDDADTREFLSFLLESAGAIVLVATSAPEVLLSFERFNPDILLSDIGMPGMDGYALIQAIRATEQGQNLPAIALTAYAGELDQQQALATGFQQHISKPVDADILLAIVMKLARRI